tara:strand:- start:32165 stop:32971 length:807 start_codon:yes stop_codon:yes gene_type:complete
MRQKRTNITKWAVVLCGGMGSRLGEITSKIPKALVQVHNKPIIWYTFWTLYNNGIRNFIFPLGYKGKMIKKYISEISKNLGCNLILVETGINSPIHLRINRIKDYIPKNEDFFILNSDTLFDFDFSEMYSVHKNQDALITLSSVNVISTWGLILFKNKDIVGFERERKVCHLFSNSKEEKGMVYSGLGLINKKALDYINLEECSDFESDLYSNVISMKKAAHYLNDGFWFPIDTPKDLQIINMVAEDRHSHGFSAKKYKDKIEKASVY